MNHLYNRVGVVTIASNVLLADPDVQGEKASHISGLGENVGSVAYLRGLDQAQRCLTKEFAISTILKIIASGRPDGIHRRQHVCKPLMLR